MGFAAKVIAAAVILAAAAENASLEALLPTAESGMVSTIRVLTLAGRTEMDAWQNGGLQYVQYS